MSRPCLKFNCMLLLSHEEGENETEDHDDRKLRSIMLNSVLECDSGRKPVRGDMCL